MPEAPFEPWPADAGWGLLHCAAIHFLAHEKSAAEQYAVILSTVVKTDSAHFVRGIELYADAKAEFDALIAKLKFDLTTGQDPARSAKSVRPRQAQETNRGLHREAFQN